MSAVATHPFACPQAGCSYRMGTVGSIPAHLAMAHPEVPMDVIAPKRSSRNVGPSTAIASSLDTTLEEIPLELVDVGDNVRVTLEAIDELAASIAEHGVLQPVKATLLPDGRYRLLWGQRRVLAARKAGLATIPALVSRGGDLVDRPIEQLVENLHRADLNPIDRAEALRKVVDAGVSQADLARKLGIAPSTVANDLRILSLDNRVVDLVRKGEITGSHAKAMVTLTPEHQRDLASRIVATKLTSHQVEQELSWRRADTVNKEAAAQRTEGAIPKAIAALEGASVTKSTKVHVRGAYNLEAGVLDKAISAAGWPTGNLYVRERPAKGKCDCSVVTLEFNRKWTVTPGCVNDKHQDRQRNLDHLEENQRNEAISAKVETLEGLLVARLADVDTAVLVLMAAWNTQDLPELLAGASDADPDQLRATAAKHLAAKADATRQWGTYRTAAEAALDRLLELLAPIESEG